MSQIKNIIFDFGGVIYDIDHMLTKQAFKALGLTNFEKLYSHSIQTKLFEDFEIGRITPSEFRAQVKKHLPDAVSDKEIDSAWNALLLGFDYSRIDLLEKIKEHYTIYLLSNTNEIHYQEYMGELESKQLKTKFQGLFKKLYFSHQIGMRKPNKNCFEFVLKENNLINIKINRL